MKRLSHYACQWLLLVCGLTASISASATGRDEVVFYFNDALGSAVAAVSESGNLCWSEVYSGYGEKTIDSDHGLNGEGCGVLGEERGYTGHTQDWETDLVYMQQRYYDASIGRFLSIDPLDADPNNPMTFNRYAYGNNNPYKYIDPDGRLGTFLHGLQKDLSMQEAVQIGGMGNAAVAAGVGAVGLVASAVAPGPEDLATGAVAAAAGAARIGKMFDVPNSAADRASEIHKAVPAATQNRTTIAVTKTAEGVRVISSSERRLRPAQRRLLRENEIEGVGAGHAEVTGVNHARGAGLNPTGTAASRPICNNCQDFLKQEGINPLSPLK